MSMLGAIVPKSDQINADDLLGQTLDITVTRVDIRAGTEQPVSIYFDGDKGKPYKPGKSMCRVMVDVWGPDAAAYVGRSMRLYRDPEVSWGGMKVGGIRISHMTHMDEPHRIALTVTKGKKRIHEVVPLDMTRPPPPRRKTEEAADKMVAAFDACETSQDVMLTIDKARAGLDMLLQRDPASHARADAARAAAYQRHVKPPEEGA